MGGAAEEEEEEKNEAWKPASTHTQTAWLINYNTLRIMFTRTAFESNTNSIADKLQDVLNTIRIILLEQHSRPIALLRQYLYSCTE